MKNQNITNLGKPCALDPQLHWWSSQLLASEVLRLHIPSRLTVELLCGPKDVVDDTYKMLLRGCDGKPIAVAVCASSQSPRLPLRNWQQILAISDLVGSSLAQAIIQPICCLEVNELTSVILPYCRPFSRGKFATVWNRYLLGDSVLRWLREAVAISAKPAGESLLKNRFQEPLESLARNTHISGATADEARIALDRLESYLWRPKLTFMHGDLWIDNILRVRSPSPWNFILIDWAGASAEGYPVYDTIRFCQSLGISSRKLFNELTALARILDCCIIDLKGYQLAYLGWLGENLGGLPVGRYLELVEHVSLHLRSTVATFNL